MKIGIVVFSQTEHTSDVAQKLLEKYSEMGHDAEIQRVVPLGEVAPRSKAIEFQNKPDIGSYDAIVFGSPVHAFSLAAPMELYLKQIESMQNKKIACFVTKGLPFNWTGGNSAIGKMKKICESKGGTVVATDIIVWRGDIEEKIGELIRKFSILF